MTSRVVPAWGDTMAADRPAKLLRILDFPTFTGPAMATTGPSRNRSPRRWSSSSAPISPCSSRAISSAGATRSCGTSPSSGKSMIASTSASAAISRVRHSSARSPNRPAKLPERLAPLGLGLRADQIGEALDPGEVELAVLEGAAREFAGLRRPKPGQPAEHRHHAPQPPRARHGGGIRPCPRRFRCSGPGNHSTSASSIGSRAIGPGSRSRASIASRGAGILRASAISASPARGPLTRTTAIAAGSRPDDSAKMVDGSMEFHARRE